MFRKTVLFAFLLSIIWQISEQEVRKNRDLTKYSGCGQVYQCFAMSNKCLQTKDCAVLLKTKPLGSGLVSFNLFWERPLDSKDSYVAAGISDDKRMGDDLSVTFVIQPNQTVTSEKGLTFHDPAARKAGVTPIETDRIQIQNVKYANGLLTGQWTLDQRTTARGLTFDTRSKYYYIMLAYGEVKDGTKQHHTQRWVSENAVYLNQNKLI